MANYKGTEKRKEVKQCSVDGCNSAYHDHGMCERHRRQIRKYGEIFNTDRSGRIKLNRFVFEEDQCFMVLDDRWGNEKAKTLIDSDDFDRVSKYKWTLSVSSGNNYVISSLGGKLSKRLHQFVLNFYGNSKIHVDHINGDGLDNRKVNLRVATCCQNRCNTRKQVNKTTGFRGVAVDKKKYTARIQFEKEQYRLGSFASAEEAARAYDEAAMHLHGEFATLNFPR